jgi:predicted dienelactone hydrolase
MSLPALSELQQPERPDMNPLRKSLFKPNKAAIVSLTGLSLAISGLLAFSGYCTAAPNSESLAASKPAEAMASPAAQESVSVQNFDWQDAARNRTVPVRLYLPDASVAGNKAVPLIVFSHGLGGSRNGYQYLGRYWASHGYASLHVQHIGSDSSLWRGNPFGLTMRLTSAAQDSEAMARAKDVSFALTELLAMPNMAARVDANRIVAAGHSYGANTTMLLVGAAVPRKTDAGNEVLNLRDPRIKAAMLLSAPPFYGYSNPAAILGGIALPTLHITATGDDIVIPGYGSGFEDRVTLFNAMGDARKTLVVFTGGSHSIFTDRTTTGGVELNPKVKAATQALSLAFLKQTFGGEATAVADWQPKFADLLARFVPAK